MSRPKYLLVAVAIVASTLAVAAPAGASTRIGPMTGGPCHAAVDAYWPAQHRAFAHYVVARESHGIPTAANPTSSARGCFQMLLRYSAPFYKAVGCTNAMWANATCNVRAAYVMFQKAGASPWRTNYGHSVKRSYRRH